MIIIYKYGQGFGMLFRSVEFSVPLSMQNYKNNIYWTSALLRDLQKMAASKPIS
jgi:hypothetical protein